MNMTVLFKKYTYGLLLAATTIIGFCNAGSYTYTGTVDGFFDSYKYLAVLPIPSIQLNSFDNFDIVCSFSNYNLTSGSPSNVKFNIAYFNPPTQANITISMNQNYFNSSLSYNYTQNAFPFFVFFQTNSSVTIAFDYSCTFSGNNIIDQSSIGGGNCDYSDYELKSNITESYCTNKFNTLIPISSVDSNYCSTNGLCPYNCPEGTGDVQWSSLYINDIQHNSNENIYIEIPEEIERDYNYGEDNTEIEVIGYGYDQDKMQQLVNTQYYTPTSEDMTNLVGKIADFLPLLAIMLLIVRTWYLIKKVF